MSLTYDDFSAAYPEFADVPQAADRVIAESALMLSPAAWGRWHDLAQGLWTAHCLALDYDISGKCAELGMKSPYDVGAASCMSAGTSSLSISSTATAMLTGGDPILADFARTTYGMRYLNLLYTVIPAGGVVYSPDAGASKRGER